MTRRTIAIGVLLAALVAALYVTRLQFAPVYLMHDESQYAVQADSIATTGHDVSGRLLPLFFTEPEFPAGRDPALIYAIALFLKVLPLSEGNVRLVTACVGLLNVAVMFLVARRLFKSDLLGLLAAVLLALTPAHFIRSRLALSPLLSIPFILAWLLTLTRFAEKPERRQLCIAGVWLGLGVYTYLACVVMMPVYLVLTAIVAIRRHTSRWALPLLAGFVVTLVPMAAWYATHPERYAQIVEAYQLFSSDAPAVGRGARVAIDGSVRTWLGLWWSCFDPSFLFISGDSSLINSTRQIGFFPLAFACLIPAGVYRLARYGDDVGRLILAGFVSAPLATVLSGSVEMNRLMFVIPFGVLVAAFGAQALLVGTRVWRWVGLALLITVPLQFNGFYSDYMGRYRMDSSAWFGGDIRSALTEVIRTDRRDGRQIYLSWGIPFIHRYWPFYAVAENRRDLVAQGTMFTWEDLPFLAPPIGSVLVCTMADQKCGALGGDPAWTLVRAVTEPTGQHSFSVYERR